MTKDEFIKGTRILEHDGKTWHAVPGKEAIVEQIITAYVELAPDTEGTTDSSPDSYDHPEYAPYYLYGRVELDDVVENIAALRGDSANIILTEYTRQLSKVKDDMWLQLLERYGADIDKVRFIERQTGGKTADTDREEQ
jgi:hypothetical protein